jgi:hypothetical protein
VPLPRRLAFSPSDGVSGVEAGANVTNAKDASAVEEMRNLRRHVEGRGSAADRNDWITDCAGQLEVREAIDLLVTNLGG